MPKYRLLQVAEIDGALLPRGAIVEKPSGWKGPMMTVSPKRTFRPDDLKDVPMFEEVEEEKGAE